MKEPTKLFFTPLFMISPSEPEPVNEISLKRYIVKRCLLTIPMFFAISILTFAIIHLAPGDPVDYVISLNPDAGPELIKALKEKMGLDQPIWTQYYIWLTQLLSGKFGYSYRKLGAPVIDLLYYKIWNTIKLTFASIILSLIIAIPAGVISAVKQYSKTDHLCRLMALFGYSMPTFWTALILIILFSVKLELLPASGMTTLGVTYVTPINRFIDEVYHMILPTTVLGIVGAAFILRLIRSSMLEVLSQDYITTARAKGVRERVVIYKHALRNAMLPVVTAVGLQFGFLLSGASVTESVFGWPGMGREIVQATLARDYPVIMAIAVIVGVWIIFVNLVTDIVYALLDPRIRY